MPPEWKAFLDLLLGPWGLTIGALALLWLLYTERLVPRGRLSEKEADRREALDLLKQSLAGSEAVARQIEERNRLEEARLARVKQGVRPTLDDDEDYLTGRRR